MSEVTIRKSIIQDMEAVMDAHHRSIVELCSKDYNEEQIRCWSSVKYSDEIWRNSIENEYHLAIEKNGKIEGFCHSCVHKDGIGEIKGLYFTKEISGQGYGRKAFEKSLSFFKENECKKIIITGTKTAKPFYEKMGFSCMDKKVLNIRGAELICYSMEMYL